VTARHTAAKERLRDARQTMYRELILDAAEAVFAEHGYEAAKVQSMAEAAGVSLATLYAAFATKWDIYRAVHARRLDALLACIRDSGAEAEGPLEQMLSGIDAYVEFLLRHPDYLRMHLQEGHAWAAPHTLRSPEQITAWQEGLERTAESFAMGVRAGIYIDDEPPLFMARTMMAMHQVRLADWVAGDMKEPVDEVTHRLHRQFIRTFCRPEIAAELARGNGSGGGGKRQRIHLDARAAPLPVQKVRTSSR
jgi:AcrR family transcriptional regulator